VVARGVVERAGAVRGKVWRAEEAKVMAAVATAVEGTAAAEVAATARSDHHSQSSQCQRYIADTHSQNHRRHTHRLTHSVVEVPHRPWCTSCDSKLAAEEEGMGWAVAATVVVVEARAMAAVETEVAGKAVVGMAAVYRVRVAVRRAVAAVEAEVMAVVAMAAAAKEAAAMAAGEMAVVYWVVVVVQRAEVVLAVEVTAVATMATAAVGRAAGVKAAE
jgi:hypothetical protein